MNVTRRQALRNAMLGGAAVIGGSVLLAGCVTNPAGGYELNPAFIDAVISTLQSGCAVGTAFIPTASSIAAVVAALFGPAAVATVQFVSGAITAVANEICSAVPPASSLSMTHLHARLRVSSREVPVLIGTSRHGVKIIGYRS